MNVSAAAALIFLLTLQTGAPASLYKAGEAELREGNLDKAERDFEAVISSHPNDPGAHANLGVVLMRRRQWAGALQQLRLAANLAPVVTGVRLNIGLVEFHSGNYPGAIPAFESVLRDEPESSQARYLLGLCQFLLQRYAAARGTLAPLRDAQSNNLQFLYVYGIAAGQSGDIAAEESALDRLMAIGHDAPEMHLWAGKAYFARGDDTRAARELRLAIQGNPGLAFAHYYLGRIARNQQQIDEARNEFVTDRAVSPDTAYDDEELGNLSATAGDTVVAEKYYREALKSQPQLVTSRYGLAKALRAEGRLIEALSEVDRAIQTDRQSPTLHYLRAQILQKLGRSDAAQKEFAISATLRQKVRENLEKNIGLDVDAAMLSPAM